MSDVTRILSQIGSGDPKAAESLLPLVYEELRKLAAAKLAHEQPGQTLQATALVHEAYLRLVGSESGDCWENRGHFFAAAAEAMRRILVERARRKLSLKHGGDWQRVALSDPVDHHAESQLVALDDALTQLAIEDPQAARVVVMKHFGQLTHEQVAEVLGISVYQARQKWVYGRAWLRSALEG